MSKDKKTCDYGDRPYISMKDGSTVGLDNEGNICSTGKKTNDYPNNDRDNDKDYGSYSGSQYSDEEKYGPGAKERYEAYIGIDGIDRSNSGATPQDIQEQAAHLLRHQQLMKGFTGQWLGGYMHNKIHCRNYEEKPNVNKEMLAAVRKIDRENNAQAINFILFHKHYLNDDDMYWLSATFNYHGPKGLAVNIVDLSNNCLKLEQDNGLPFFSFKPYNTPRNILRLDLSNNNIGDYGAKVVADGLANGVLPITKRIDLSGNKITKEGDNKLVQALKSKVQDMSIVTQKLENEYKMTMGSKEEKIAIYKDLIKQGVEKGTYDKGIVVDKSFLGLLKQTGNIIVGSSKGAAGFVKCNWKPDDLIKSYAQDKITAKISKTLSKVLGKFTDIEGVVSCYLEASNEAWTSPEGQALLKHELCVLGEQEFCGEQ
jgi:hypothetical protein